MFFSSTSCLRSLLTASFVKGFVETEREVNFLSFIMQGESSPTEASI